MGGLIAGYKQNGKIREPLLRILKRLEYSGHDSAGLCIGNDKDCYSYRIVGSVDELTSLVPDSVDGEFAIAHTRWSTYNKQIIENVYPIVSQNKVISVVCNGLIDNVLPVKKQLERRGYEFKTTSAVEVLANLLEEVVLETTEGVPAIRRALKQLEGDFSFVFTSSLETNKLYFARNKSNLLLGKNGKDFWISSEYSAIADVANRFYRLNDYEHGYFHGNNVVIHNHNDDVLEPVFSKLELADDENLELSDYEHHMIKEIEEAPRVIRRVINRYFDVGNFRFDEKIIRQINRADNIVFLAAGTSYHAALIGQRYLRTYNKQVDVYIASEWYYYPYKSEGETLYILISQSGETNDLIECLSVIKRYNGITLTITNTEVSTLYREADFQILLHAGAENSVASTKAYVAQITVLTLLYAQLINKSSTVISLDGVVKVVNDIIKRREEIRQLAVKLVNHRDVYFLGRGFDADIALEAQLKLKETTYIHAEAYPGGEIGHGPIALIDEGTPVIVFISDKATAKAMRENIVDLKKSGADVITCVSEEHAQEGDSFVVKTVKGYHSPITFAVFSQYLAYYTAILLGRNVDRPRNLKKSVS